MYLFQQCILYRVSRLVELFFFCMDECELLIYFLFIATINQTAIILFYSLTYSHVPNNKKLKQLKILVQLKLKNQIK